LVEECGKCGQKHCDNAECCEAQAGSEGNESESEEDCGNENENNGAKASDEARVSV